MTDLTYAVQVSIDLVEYYYKVEVWEISHAEMEALGRAEVISL